MEKSVSRPQRIEACDLNLAVEEALQRIAQSNELTHEECMEISGGFEETLTGRM